MPNFVKIPRQINKFSIKKLDCHRSVCMAAISYNGPISISAAPTNKQLLGEKITCAKFQIDISKTDELVRVYTGVLYMYIWVYANVLTRFRDLCVRLESKTF